MEITREEAEQLCSAEEMELVEASLPPKIKTLGITELRANIGRAKRLQDKYRDLSHRQSRGAKETGALSGLQNVRTQRKAQLFVETRERLEDHLGELAEEA